MGKDKAEKENVEAQSMPKIQNAVQSSRQFRFDKGACRSDARSRPLFAGRSNMWTKRQTVTAARGSFPRGQGRIARPHEAGTATVG